MGDHIQVPSGTVPTAGAPTTFTSDLSLDKYKVTRNAYMDAYPSPKLNGICVAACVFDKSDRVLLLQRAAHDSMPLRWEIPGGACDKEDESLMHGAVRELWEEAGVRAVSVDALIGEGYGFFSRRGALIWKFAFIVTVETHDVKLDPNEHQSFVWATEDEVRAKKCGDIDLVYTSENQLKEILVAFEWKKAKVAQGSDEGMVSASTYL
ncbi:NUDIX hydrolase domain-like protein [Xylariaceae sp. FL1019]|nr:NUDIX hydrolase domain-like protein [Xylariaceae sp. FL1019]